MTDGLIAQHRPPFAHGNDPAPGEAPVRDRPVFTPPVAALRD
ncbi:hypothetical protein [Streptomyces viridochromogenes]|uniref:Uncharacterized protein n=1 Tax=Streptomyces viridochromogenes Tue57 TaxID=1160705 RepID=L8PJJ6_STRVR|nr:hypothetical protein [Streptomyces viridochromogenes]ELS57701.1 hypothetical protein STVIR_1345 [Streptomyces viridochromogenes Tue57]